MTITKDRQSDNECLILDKSKVINVSEALPLCSMSTETNWGQKRMQEIIIQDGKTQVLRSLIYSIHENVLEKYVSFRSPLVLCSTFRKLIAYITHISTRGTGHYKFDSTHNGEKSCVCGN